MEQVSFSARCCDKCGRRAAKLVFEETHARVLCPDCVRQEQHRRLIRRQPVSSNR